MQSGDYPDTALAFAGIPHDRGHRADPRRGPARPAPAGRPGPQWL